MKINLKFNARSSSQNIPEAKALAQKLGGIIIGKYYSVDFESPDDKNLETLFNLVGHLLGSQISIDGSDPINPKKFFHALNCDNKLLCKGVCTHYSFGPYDIEQFPLRYANNIEEYTLTTYENDLVARLTNLLEPVDDSHFKINKELVLAEFITETDLERQYCEKYDLKKIKETIALLPDEIELISIEEYREQKEVQEPIDEFSIIADLLLNAEIDSKLSFQDILECTESIALILSFPRGWYLNNSEVIIYSFPSRNKFALIKYKEHDVIPVDDEGIQYEQEGEEEELPDIITRDNNIFCIKNSYIELYFKVINETGTDNEYFFNLIKKL